MRRIFLNFAIIFTLILFWYGESRSFYCLANGNCITVWKTFNHVCYIIPGKYYGLIKPSDNFIESSNNNYLTIYFSYELPNTFVYKSEQAIKIENFKKSTLVMLDYNADLKKYDSIFYKAEAKKNNDVKDNVELMDLFIQEGFAIDKQGKMF